MPGQLSVYGASQILGGYFGMTNTPPATWYFALTTTPPDLNATGSTLSEPAGANYSRLAITNDSGPSGHWTVNANSAYVFNSQTMWWPAGPPVGATSDWPTCTGWALCDALTAGNVWAVGTLGAQVSTPAGFCAYLGANTLSLELSPFYNIATG